MKYKKYSVGSFVDNPTQNIILRTRYWEEYQYT